MFKSLTLLGILAVIVGILAIAWPGVTILATIPGGVVMISGRPAPADGEQADAAPAAGHARDGTRLAQSHASAATSGR